MRIETILENRQEWMNYLRYASLPRSIIPCILWGLRAGIRRLRKPPSLVKSQRVLDSISHSKRLTFGGENNPLAFDFKFSQSSISLPVCFRLAGVSISANDFSKTLRNISKNVDPEYVFAFHRFSWIPRFLISTPNVPQLEEVASCLKAWLGHFTPHKDSPGWDTYSASERIVNLSFYYWILRNHKEISSSLYDFVYPAIIQHVNYVQENLEFRGDFTNNHIINNARALYIGGYLAGNQESMAIAREILRITSSKYFSPSGFLREGSSHYHILICRHFLECFWFAKKSSDMILQEYLGEFMVRSVQASSFFLDAPEFPSIGDVAPDTEPEFHLGLIDGAEYILGRIVKADGRISRISRGWNQLFSEQEECIPKLALTHNYGKSILAYPDAGYYRIRIGPYLLFIYVMPLNYVPAWSHGHADVGGFLLYWGNQLVLIDSGRSTYLNNEWGQYGRSVRSHNSISIDNKEPCVIHGLNAYPEFMEPRYFPSPPEVIVEKESNENTIVTVKYYGFQRVHGLGDVTRKFICEKGRILIQDQINGTGNHKIETFFHFHPDLKVTRDSNSSLRVPLGEEYLGLVAHQISNSSSQLLYGQKYPEILGWYSPKYGICHPTFTWKIVQNTSLPVRNVFMLESLN